MLNDKVLKDKRICQNRPDLFSSKSSLSFITGIINKPEREGKSFINFSKVLKPSASNFKKYIHESKTEIQSQRLERSINKSIENIINEKSTILMENLALKNEESLMLKEFAERIQLLKKSAFFKVQLEYKQEKKKILHEKQQNLTRIENKISEISKENEKLRILLSENENNETREVTIIDQENNFSNEILHKLIEKHGSKIVVHEISEAISEELCHFKVNAFFLSLIRINTEIQNFFDNNLLENFYSDISIALCKKIITHMKKSEKIANETEKLRLYHKKIVHDLEKSIRSYFP